MRAFVGFLCSFLPGVVVCLILFSIPGTVAGQASSASLSVLVTDPTGALLSDADVAIHNSDTNQEQKAHSGKSGTATFSFLKPGRYSLTISKEHFSDIVVDNIILNVGDERKLQQTLRLGSAAESITVDGSGVSINTTDASVSTVVSGEVVANMPLNGRSFQDLVSLTPGVVTNSPQRTSQAPTGNGDFSINGQRSESNYYVVDGVAANVSAGNPRGAGVLSGAGGVVPAASALGTTQSLLSVDALQEFRVESSSYSAEYGRSAGGQLTFITRSGTNHYHGTAYDYLRNGYFDANDWFNDHAESPKQSLRQNDFGGTFGGPIWIPRLYRGIDKTFFFVSYEGLRLTQPTAATVEYVPDTFMRQQAPPALRTILNAYPLQSPNGIDYGSETSPSMAQFVQGYSSPGKIDSTSVRLDHNFSDKFSAFLRVANTPSSVQSRVLSVLTPIEINTQTYTLGLTYALSNAVTNQFRFGYAVGDSTSYSTIDSFGGATPTDLGRALGMTSGTTGRNVDAIADVYIPGAGAGALETPGEANSQHQWNIVDTFDITHRNHHLRLGVDVRRISTYNPTPTEVEGVFESTSQVLSNIAYETALFRTLPSNPVFNQVAAFAQDEWKINSRLSLSGGLRWELAPPPHNSGQPQPYTLIGNLGQPGTLSLAPSGTPLWPTSWYNFAPRLGLAWQMHNSRGTETVVRVGGGIFFDTSNEAGTGSFNDLGFVSSRTYKSSPLPITPAQQDFDVTVSPPYSAVAAYPSHLQLPYTEQWNVSVEQSLGVNQTISISYVGSAGRRLSSFQEQSISEQNSLFSNVIQYASNTTSDYESLQAKFQRTVRRGVTALVSYTWSHSLDYGSTFNAFPVIRGNSDFDVRNNFQAGLVWNLPSLGRPAAVATLLDGWSVDGRLLARTAFPVSLQGNLEVDPATGSEYYTSVNLNPGVPLYLYGDQYPGGRALNGRPGATNPALTLPSGSDYGDAPRNFARGFGESQVNLAVRRAFTLSDNLQLQFRAEAFNVFNHPNFGYVDPTLTDPTFGEATQMLNQSLGTVASQYQQGGPRSMQFALKLSF